MPRFSDDIVVDPVAVCNGEACLPAVVVSTSSEPAELLAAAESPAQPLSVSDRCGRCRVSIESPGYRGRDGGDV